MKRIIPLITLLSVLVGCSHKPVHRSVAYEGEIRGMQFINYDDIGHRFVFEGFRAEDKKSGLVIVIEDNDESGVVGDCDLDRRYMIMGNNTKKISVEEATRFYHKIKNDTWDKLFAGDFDTLV